MGATRAQVRQRYLESSIILGQKDTVQVAQAVEVPVWLLLEQSTFRLAATKEGMRDAPFVCSCQF